MNRDVGNLYAKFLPGVTAWLVKVDGDILNVRTVFFSFVIIIVFLSSSLFFFVLFSLAALGCIL